MKYIIIACFLMCFFSADAQSFKRKENVEDFNGLKIGIAPSSVLDLISMTLPVGVEYCFGKWGVNLEYGIPLAQFSYQRDAAPFTLDKNINHDHRIRLDIKKYASIQRTFARTFLGLEFVYRDMNYSSVYKGYYDNSSGNMYGFDYAHIHSRVFSISPILGASFMWRHFYFDVFTGLGYKFVHRNFLSIVNKTKDDDFEGLFHREDDVYGNNGMIYLTFGLKVGVPLKFK